MAPEHNDSRRRPSISLFSNCGAGDYGYKSAGFDFVVMAELVPKRLRVAGLNHPSAELVPGDLRSTWLRVVEAYRRHSNGEEPWLLSACPPCQGMSSANSKRGKEDDVNAGGRDPRNLLVSPIIEVATRLRPRAIVVENVPAFLTKKIPHPNTDTACSAASLLVETLQNEYVVFPLLCDLAHYGVPQRRRRAFLTFIRRDVPGLGALLTQRRAPYPRPTHDPAQGGDPPITVAAFLSELDLPSLDARERDSALGGHPLHLVPVWSKHHYNMVKAIPRGSGRSAWENQVCPSCGSVDVDDTDACCPKCYDPLLRPVVQEPDGTYRLIRGFRASSYRRMNPDLPAPAVTTANGTIGSATTIHPCENRVLSVLECCHLQTIPTSFKWTRGDIWPLEPHVVRRMVGEAVPPKFTELHGQAIRGSLEDSWRLAPISMFDTRCKRARNKMSTAQGPLGASASAFGLTS